MDQQPPLPTSLGEVESETLQRIQKSPEGWQLAQALLDRPIKSTTDDQVKFFGALTIIIKLNTERTDMRVAKFSAVHSQLLQNAADVSALLHAGLTSQISEPHRTSDLRRESIKSLQSWVLYAQRLPQGGEVLVVPLRALVGPVISCLENEELYEAAIELLIDILSNYSSFFTGEHYEAIVSIFESPWGEQRLHQLVGGDFDFEPLQYGLLLLAYGDARVQTLLQSPDERSQKTLSALCLLLTAAGHPVAEDLIFVPALEFWSTFIETLIDTMYSDEDGHKPWLQPALSFVMQVVSHCWEKIQYPPIKAFMSWDASDRAGFKDARKDVADLLQTVFAVAGRDLLMHFSDLLLRSISEKAWSHIEAAAFCLAAMSDCISDDSGYDELLSRIFSSPLFNLLELGESQLSVRLRQTALTLIERYSEYFERHSDNLPAALNLLFEAVSTASLTAQASKSISTLCSSCRALLTPEAGAFLQQYQLLHDNPQLDALAEERIVNAIAAIIQATTDEETRLGLFEQLLTFVVRDVEQCLQLKSGDGNSLDVESPLVAKAARQFQQQQSQENQTVPSVDDVLLQAVLISLRCLAAMARGFQSTTEAVDLDADDTTNSREASASGNSRLFSLQTNIMAMMAAVQTAFPRSGEVVEVVCSILKAGFSETESGPFVFPPAMVTEFLIRQNSQTPYIGSIVNTSYSFVSSLHKSSDHEAMLKSLGSLIPWAIGLLQMLPEPDVDTELTQRGIEFIDRVLRKSPAIVLQLQPTSLLEFFFMFTLKVLDSREPLPKAASADFWTSFITLKPEDTNLQAAVGNALEHLGPLVAQSLMQNIGGNASRSELDKLSEPLKKLVVQHPRASTWLEQALMSPSFPSDRVTAAEKAFFLKKIIR
ncbi:importin [Grosmannia clavigera kw1407]|uniref:Importin n=1 Tax=Grosmannia clavigera (strain kw1407 / UAMH 11150) TaxID=655863 RepID=F0XQ08_GROCL|nr:importin [Grosmannia clavigera kw1407]EFX00419.1 importin [Grosmannia clavigera kw1407]